MTSEQTEFWSKVAANYDRVVDLQIGRNTRYIIHPEEILADNFVLLVRGERKVRTPRIIDDLQRVLAEK